MYELLINPAFPLGITVGMALGGAAAAGLIYSGFRAHERRLLAEAERYKAAESAAASARAWATAANDGTGGSGTARAQMRGGPR